MAVLFGFFLFFSFFLHSPFFFPGPKYKRERLEQATDKRPLQVYRADITQKKLLSYTDKVRKDNFLYVICLAQCERDQNVRRVLTQERALIYQFAKTIDTIFREGG